MKEIKILIDDELLTDEVQGFVDEATKCIRLYAAKNHDYGNSFEKGMDVIGKSYGIGRIYDKVNRLLSVNTKGTVVKEESADDTLRDLACYSLMMLAYNTKKRDEEQAKINFE